MAPPSEPLVTDRAALWARLCEPRTYDLAVVGGGATGLGVALDAALRGLSVVLVESHDFAKGTSSRATKLVHGGVRYLAQGNVGLVYEALHERTHLLGNAPHLAQPLPFVMPAYHWCSSEPPGITLREMKHSFPSGNRVLSLLVLESTVPRSFAGSGWDVTSGSKLIQAGD